MKVLLLNGSRREKGCTYTALTEIAHTLEQNGVESEIIHAVPTMENIKGKRLTGSLSARLYIGHRLPVKSWNLWTDWQVLQVKTCFTNRQQRLLLLDAPALRRRLMC